MKFTKAEPHQDCSILRLVSEQGKWEIGIRPVLFGVRVSMTRIGDQWYTLDYCAADQELFALVLLATLVSILDRFDEDISPAILQRQFPKFNIKPINLDTSCWAELQVMAGADIESIPSIVCPHCGKRSYSDKDIAENFCSHCYEKRV